MKLFSEEHCQIFVVSFLKKLQILCPDTFEFWATPNGGKRDKATAGAMKLQGVLAGVYDIVIVATGRRILFVENKKFKGKLGSEQIKFKNKMNDFGFDCCEIYADTPHDMVAGYCKIMLEYFKLPQNHIVSSSKESLARCDSLVAKKSALVTKSE